jgi:hypothetical protein
MPPNLTAISGLEAVDFVEVIKKSGERTQFLTGKFWGRVCFHPHPTLPHQGGELGGCDVRTVTIIVLFRRPLNRPQPILIGADTILFTMSNSVPTPSTGVTMKLEHKGIYIYFQVFLPI